MSSRTMATLAVVLVASLSLLATFVWVRQMTLSTEAARTEWWHREVTRAVSVLDDKLVGEATALDQAVSVVAEDSRIKANLATRAFDAATLSDMLNEIREKSRFEWLALADSAGQVEAVSGLDSLKAYQGADLGPTPLIKSAEEKETAVSRTLWFSSGQAVAIACAGVWRAGRIIGFVLLGKTIDGAYLDRTAKVLGVSVGLTAPKGELVASTPEAAEALKLAARQSADAPTTGSLGESVYALAKKETSGWASGLVVAAAKNDALGSAESRHFWLPLIFVGVLVITVLTHLWGVKPYGQKR